MKEHKSQVVFKILVVSFLTAYLLGSFTNMLFIQHYVPEYSKAASIAPITLNRQEVSAKFQHANLLQVFDKSTVDNDLFNESSFIPKSLVINFTGSLPGAQATSFSPKNNIYNNQQLSYLYFCTLRI